MKLQFKKQAYQTAAVEAVADCFAGQPKSTGIQYRVDPGRVKGQKQLRIEQVEELTGFKNTDIAIPTQQLLENIQVVQRRQNLPLSTALASNKVCRINLDIEMETGTGKTYCYIKSMFELHQRYGWSKFIVVVPSIAIREGVRSHSRSRPSTFWRNTASGHGSSSTTRRACTRSKASRPTPGST